MNEKVIQEARAIMAGFFAERRKELNLSQKQLAINMEVSESTIIRIEQGKFWIRQDIYLKLCHHLQLAPFLVPKESDLFKQFQAQMQYKQF